MEARPQAVLPGLAGNALKPAQPRLSFLDGNTAGISGVEVRQLRLWAEAEVCGPPQRDPAPSPQLPEGTPAPGATPTSSSLTPAHGSGMVWGCRRCWRGDRRGSRAGVVPGEGAWGAETQAGPLAAVGRAEADG